MVTTALSYAKGLVVLDANRLVVAQGTPASVVVVNIATGAQQAVLPGAYAGYSYAYNAVQLGSYVYVQLVTPDQRIIRFNASTMTFAGEVAGITGTSFAQQLGSAGTAGGFYALGKKASGASSLFAVNGSTLAVTDTGVVPNWMSGLRLWPVTIGGATWLTSIGTTGIVGRWNPATGAIWTRDVNGPGVPENLGNPINSYSILDSVLSNDALGRPTLYGSTYNAPSAGVTFFGVDPVSGAVRTQLTMPGAYGGYHVAAAPDGRIYLGPLNSASAAQLWRYDPAANTVALVATMPAGIMCFGVTVSSFTGLVYCGTHSGNAVYEYNPTSGAIRLVTTALSYAKGLVVLDSNRLVLAQGTPASVVVVNIATGAQQAVLPAAYAGYSYAYNAVRLGNYVYVQLVTPDQRIIRFNASTMAFAGEVAGITGTSFAQQLGSAGTAGGFYALGKKASGASSLFAVNGSTLAVTDTGVVPNWMSGLRLWPITISGATWLTSIGTTGIVGRWNPATGAIWTNQVTLPAYPTNITATAVGPDGHIYGGTYETNALFGFNPGTGQTTVYGNVAPGRSGEILSMVTAGAKLFIGSYIDNVVTVYDPSQPWQPGSAAGSNPRDLGPIGAAQNRPWGMTVGPDGRVWVASAAGYGQLSGALSAINPNTMQVQSFRGIAGNQQLRSVVGGSGVVYAGTTRYGDNTDAGGDAQLLTVNPATGAVISAVIPVPGAGSINSLTISGDGKLWGSADGSTFRLDPTTGSIINFGPYPSGLILSLRTGPDGAVYGTTGWTPYSPTTNPPGTLSRIDPVTYLVSTVASPGGGFLNYSTVSFDAAGRAYWGSGPTLMRVTLDAPPG